jgi:hypothetical protein
MIRDSFLKSFRETKSPFITNPYRFAADEAVGGWTELARTTLGSAGDDITVGSLSDKRYYMVLVDGKTTGGIDPALRLNADTGSNYANRRSENGGTDATNTSLDRMALYSALDTPYFQVGYLANLAIKEKLFQGHLVGRNTAGAGNAPTRAEFVGKHAQTSNPISSVTQRNNGTGDHSIGAEVVVLGWDPADTHTTNFWEELASVSGTSLDTGVSGFAAKKYLWIQTYIGTPTALANHSFIFNGDTGSNYAVRYQIDGSGEGTDAPRGDALIPHQGGASETGIFANTFIINNSANEKLIISHEVVEKGAGAAAVPARYEHAGKWANTSAQITDIALTGTYGATSEMRVWGSD